MAVLKGSFYEAVPVFEADADAARPFRGLRARPVERPEPVLEHSVAQRQRLDALAHHYYADSRAWRRIADTNPEALFAEDLLFDPEPPPGAPDENGRERVGEIILIPRRREVP
ncbi:MAG TPA: hypothetical protein VNR89_01675 [Roseomonas sp.]|nr:hypothetical protein [Roseomonas sp.]